MPATSTLLMILLGAVIGTGVVLLIVSLRPTSRAPKPSSGPGIVQRIGRRTLLAVGVGLVVLLVTKWPGAAVAAAALVVTGPALLGGAKAEREAMARLEGLATWT